MGSGKKAVARVLADRVDRLFVDLDKLVESGARTTMIEILEKEGESGLRNRERRALVVAATGPLAVVATGGGTYADRGNRKTIAGAGVAVWLDAPFASCMEHCRDQIGTRPLYRDEEAMESLYQTRREDYGQADITVETLDRSPEILADEVMQKLEDAIWSSETLR
jgi:shikimate kinase